MLNSIYDLLSNKIANQKVTIFNMDNDAALGGSRANTSFERGKVEAYEEIQRLCMQTKKDVLDRIEK